MTSSDTVTAASYLGRNTDAPLRELLDQIRAATGVRTMLHTADDGGWSSSDAEAEAESLDLLWMCGRLYATMRAERRLDHEVVAAPIFEGEVKPVYRSVIVARPDGPSSLVDALAADQTCTLAVNEQQSWSGHHGLRRHISSFDTENTLWFADELVSGSHAASVEAVAGRRADCAAIDHTVWRFLCNTRSEVTSQLRVIATTGDWPAPPLVLSPRLDHTRQAAVIRSITEATNLPGVVVFVPAESADYDLMLNP